MRRLVSLAATVLLAGCAGPSDDDSGRAPSSPSPLEGIYEYVEPQTGQAIMTDGRYVFLFGPADQSTPTMTADAGTYRISGDTATHTITYSTNPDRVGMVFSWTPESQAGDTLTVVVMNEAGAITGRARSVKR